MQIRITFINGDVTPQPAKGKGKPYNMLEVTYKDDNGQTKTKKLMSFSNPAVFSTLKDASKGDVFDIEMEKNGEYWNWTSVTSVDGSVASAPSSGAGFQKAATTAPPGRSNFETPEERALRQRLIVRQSSLAQAIEWTKLCQEVSGEPGLLNHETMLVLAEQFYDWVYKKPDLFEQDNDLPF